jgi:molybdate transport system permease protein
LAAGFDWTPLWISLKVAGLATAISFILGLSLSYLLAKADFPGRDWLDALTTVPMVLPPVVLGYYLLVLVGKQSFIGVALSHLGIKLVFTWEGAVLAVTAVSAPLLIKTAKSAFESVDKNLEDAARTLGLSEWLVFWRVTLPLAWRGIFAGTVLAFSRALGDFGATLMVAGNIPGQTRTMPLAIFDAVQNGNYKLASNLALVITLVAILMMVLAARLTRKHLAGF